MAETPDLSQYDDAHAKCVKLSTECLICKHANRKEIHADYFNGSKLEELQLKYTIPSVSSLRNHFKYHFLVQKGQIITVEAQVVNEPKKISQPELDKIKSAAMDGDLTILQHFIKGDVDIYKISYQFFKEKLELINDLEDLRQEFKLVTQQDNVEYIKEIANQQNKFYELFSKFVKDFLVIRGDKTFLLLEMLTKRLSKVFEKYKAKYATEPIIVRALDDLLGELASAMDTFEEDILNNNLKGSM